MNIKLAYLAPEIPSLSATFVYNEIYALRSMGIDVDTFALRKPSDISVSEEDLLHKTCYLYEAGYSEVVFASMFKLFDSRIKVFKGFKMLLTDVKNVKKAKISGKLFFQFLSAVNLATRLVNQHIDHLHVHFAHVPTQIAMYASAMTGIPFTITSHANDIFERGLLLPEKALRSKRFFTISQYNIDYLKKQSVDESKLSIIRCGVSLSYNKKVPVFIGKNNTITLGSLGRLVEKKGFDVLIQAIALIHADNPGLKLSLKIAGDGPLRECLQDLVRQLQLEHIVSFEGALNHGDVSKWLNELDVFILACKQDRNGDKDGIPVVLMEAMSQSVPVITTRLSGIPELVIDKKTGYLAEPDDAESLKCKINEFMASSDHLELITENALNHVAHEFSLESNVSKLLKEFTTNGQRS